MKKFVLVIMMVSLLIGEAKAEQIITEHVETERMIMETNIVELHDTMVDGQLHAAEHFIDEINDNARRIEKANRPWYVKTGDFLTFWTEDY